ncbi:MAG: histidine kinase [Rubricoccaceae bacterium]
MTPHAPWSRRTEFVATASFWILLTALLLLRRAVGPAPFTPGAVIGTVAEFAAWVVLTPAVFALARRFPLDGKEHVVRRVLLLLAVGLAVAATVEVTRTVFLKGLVDAGLMDGMPRLRLGGAARPGRADPTAFGAVRRLQFVDEFVIYVGVLAAGFARGFALRALDRETESARLAAASAQLAAEAAALETERTRLEGQLTEARLSALRMQLNPHFLFNALNTVSAFIERDPRRAQTMVAHLAGLLRQVLDGDDRPEVPLADELALLRDYIAIQEARFGDDLSVHEQVAPDVLDALVPALVLQPLVENAFEHGVSPHAGTPARIEIGARRERVDDGSYRLVLTVSDNGPGPDNPDATHGTGVGLANTRGRLHGLYGDAASLALTAGSDGGCVVTVTMPLRHYAPPVHA